MVHGLVPGESYVFRVQAVNVFGLSEESQESSPISVEPALGEDRCFGFAHGDRWFLKCLLMT